MKTLQDVEVFISTLAMTDRLWHADDKAHDIPNLQHCDVDALQKRMDEAIDICDKHKVDIFDFYFKVDYFKE